MNNMHMYTKYSQFPMLTTLGYMLASYTHDNNF